MKKLFILLLVIALLAPAGIAEGTQEYVTIPSFNYEAIVADPDAHVGYIDYMRGTVKSYTNIDGQEGDYNGYHLYLLLMAVDDSLMHTVAVYGAYKDGDDHPKVNDTVWVHGTFQGLQERNGILGTINIPEYVCRTVVVVSRPE
jgi:hypothetical protein